MPITCYDGFVINTTKDSKSFTYDFIRGLIVGEGCFSFCSTGLPDEKGFKNKIPAFILSLSKRDEGLMEMVKNKLGLRDKIHEYQRKPSSKSHNKQPMMMLIVRDIGELKNIIVPLCHNKLFGHKAKQFSEWLKEIQINPYIPERYKILHKLSAPGGFYDRNQRFLD